MSYIRLIFLCWCVFCIIIWLVCSCSQMFCIIIWLVCSCSQRHKVHCSSPELQLLLLWWKHTSLYHHSEPEWTSQSFQPTIITACCLSSIHEELHIITQIKNNWIWEENTNYHVEWSWTTSRKCSLTLFFLFCFLLCAVTSV